MASEPLSGVSKLLVRGLNWIGDAVMSLPTIWNIRESLPTAHISILSPDWTAGLYQLCPAVDEVIVAPSKGLFSNLGLSRLLRKRRFDAALILPNSFRSALAPFLARVPHRLGYRTDGRRLLLTHAVSVPETVKSEHTVLYYRPLLEAVGINWLGERFDLRLTDDTVSEAEVILLARGARPGSQRIGFSPGAAWGPSKQWPVDKFARTARLLSERLGVQPLVFGSDADCELADTFISLSNSDAVNLAGAFEELRHLVAAIASCALLVTNDSGPMHIAAALGVPVVALFGPTDEHRSGPWSSSRVIITRNPACRPCYKPECKELGHPCMLGIEAETVVEAAEKLLKSPAERR